MFGKPMCGGRVILSAQRKGNMCVLKIPVWFCNETDTQRGRDREVEGGREGGEGPQKCQTTSLDTRWILSLSDSLYA